jgi:hypothetical protein
VAFAERINWYQNFMESQTASTPDHPCRICQGVKKVCGALGAAEGLWNEIPRRVTLIFYVTAALISFLPTVAKTQDVQFLFDATGNLLEQAPQSSAPPQILGQPQMQVVIPGESASFSVVVADTRNVSYQWLFNSSAISGATADSLVLTNVSANNEGLYSVIVSNLSGSVPSRSANLYIDSRGCGMPDSWQLTYFGNLTTAATGDYDGDGVDNLQEFLDGTNPTNSASVLYRLTVLNDAGSVTISPAQATYTNGQTVTLTAIASPPGVFRGWFGDTNTTSNPITLTMNTNMTVMALLGISYNLTWTNLAGGDWNVASNWSPNVAPLQNDNVFITNSATITLNTSADCANFTLGNQGTSPTLGGSGTLTIHGTGCWANGTMNGGGSTIISPGATLNILGPDFVSLSSRTLENAGTIIWSGAVNIDAVDSVITNEAGALFDAQNAASIYLISGNLSRIDNAGTFQKSGAGTTSIGTGIAFNNYNTLNIQNGALDLGLGGINTGIINVSANTALSLSGGSFLSSAGSSITGSGQLMVAGAAATFTGLVNLSSTNTFSAGSAEFTGNYFCTNNTLVISGGTADFDGTGTVAPTVLNMIVGGTLGGTQTVTVGSVMNWLEGTMTGGGRTVIPPGATLNIPGSDTVYLSSRTVENGGTILWTGPANIYTVDNTVITNRAGALFDAQNAASFYLVFFGGNPSRIDNAGTFRKSGAGTTSVGTGIAFNNYNTLNIQNGILSASGGYTSSPSALLNCAIGGTTAGTGFGQLQVAGTVGLAGMLTVTFTNGFAPVTNNSFPVVTADALSGVFANFNYPSNVVNMQVSYIPNSVLVLVTGIANPQFVLLPPQISGSNINLTWTAISNLTYRLEFNSNLNPTNWTAVPGDVIATTNQASKSDILTQSNRFYRVRVLP